MNDPNARYRRQQSVTPAGHSIDDRWANTRVLIVGVGGTGAPLASQLVRSGVGSITLLDPDTVDETNLARQTLFFSSDAEAGRTKVSAALEELARIGGRTDLRGEAIALTPRNAESWVDRVDLVIDATDHLPARLWIDAACRTVRRGWIHLAAIEDRYRVIGFLHPDGPCFRCYCPELPPAETLGTCESRGVLPIATQLAASHGAAMVWRAVANPVGADDPAPFLDGRVGDLAPRAAALPRDPECPGCSIPPDAPTSSEEPIRLLCGSPRAEGWRDGSPETLVEQLGPEWQVEEKKSGFGFIRASREESTATLFEDGRVQFGPVGDLAGAERLWRELFPPQ